MRYLSILPALLFIACAGPQQTAGVDDFNAPPKAEVVIVETDDSADELYRMLASDISQRGFTLSHSDATLRSLSTEWRTYREGGVPPYEMRLAVSVNDSGRATLRGWFKIPRFLDEQPITKYGQSKSIARRSWARLHKIAEAMNGSIAYE